MLWLRALFLALLLVLGAPVRLASVAAQVEPAYQDDRSDPAQVLASLVNAINRREYARAYSYWEVGSPALPPYADFAAGYATTSEVALVTGVVQADAGAGQLYYSVPVTLRSRLVDGTMQSFVGCYTLHLSQPAVQAPPFRSLAIQSAAVQQVANDVDHAALMNQSCVASGTQRPPPASGVSAPGLAVSRPVALCSDAIGCQYLEHGPLSTPYRFQSLNVCGANCSAQYWVSSADSGQQVLEIGPVRGGAILATRQTDADAARVSVRIIQPSYAPSDPGCCPSAYADTIYAWDPTTSSLVPIQVMHSAAGEFDGWDAARQQLQAEGWSLVNV